MLMRGASIYIIIIFLIIYYLDMGYFMRYFMGRYILDAFVGYCMYFGRVFLPNLDAFFGC